MGTLKTLLSISAGASCGAIFRWFLGVWLNALFPLIPLGTLCANALGGFLAGIALIVFTSMTDISPLWRICIMTGFLGALTTFSAFSLEVWELFQQQRLGWALVLIASHLVGTLAALGAGVGMAQYGMRYFSYS